MGKYTVFARNKIEKKNVVENTFEHDVRHHIMNSEDVEINLLNHIY